jgi:cell pole-organizing protein PopZ
MSGRESTPPDPSMEDILASIRDILNEEETTAPPEPPLELTEAMLLPNDAQPPVTPSTPQPDIIAIHPSPTAAQAAQAQAAQGLQALLAPAAAAATAAALGELARAVSGDRSAPISRAGASIEDVVREELRPLLKAWLDQHLPSMVEQIVKAEIARLMGPPRS